PSESPCFLVVLAILQLLQQSFSHPHLCFSVPVFWFNRHSCSGKLQRRFNSLCSVVVAGSIVTWPAFDLKKILCPGFR
ncbi:unnamed protein product, partial [Brassica oleracea var. botrytis]